MAQQIKNSAVDDCFHDRVIATLPRPAWLRSGSLIDNTWTIRTEDAELKRNASARASFDVVIAPCGVRSTDPAFEHDLITAKLIAYECLRPKSLGGITSGPALMPQMVANYFHFVRWRLSRGIRANRELTPEWIEHFIDTLRARGPFGLLPLEARVDALIENYQELGRPYPTDDKRYGASRVQLEPIAHELGLQSALSLSPELRLRIRRAAGCPTVLEVDDEVARPGKRRSDPDGLSASRFHVLLRPIELLYRYRSRLAHDAIGFDPFPHRRSTWQVAESLALRARGRTPTIPSEQACHLINQALLWVDRYSGDLLALREVFARVGGEATSSSQRTRKHAKALASFAPKNSAIGAGSPWALLHEAISSGKAEVAASYRLVMFEYLPAAAMIVVAAFAARRHEELDSLRAGCITGDVGEFWLETWISKTLRSITNIPVPDSVAKAISVLEALSATARDKYQQQWLFDFYDDAYGQRRTFDSKRALERFAEFSQVPTLPSGDEWWFSPHQFRRFFGITYFHHYRFPHLAALSQFYRHFDPDMTRIYVREVAAGSLLRIAEEKGVIATALKRSMERQENERASDFEAEALNFRIERFTNIALGRERASGWGGELLTRELREVIDAIRPTLELVGASEEPYVLNEAISAFAADMRLEPNLLRHSYCRCGTDEPALRSAECLQNQAELPNPEFRLSAPDPRYAADLTCSKCPHNVQLPENEIYWREMAAHERKQMSCALGPLLHALSERRLAGAESHIARCFE